MIFNRGKRNIYDLSGLAIVFALSTLFVMFPAHAAQTDFLDRITKFEIKNPSAPDASSTEPTSGNQQRDSSSKKTPPKQDAVRKKTSQHNKTESTINALRKQNTELRAAVKAAEKKRDDTTRELSAQIAALKAQSGQKESVDPAAVSVLTKKNGELAAAVEAAQKKRDEISRTLSAQIGSLQIQNTQSENKQKLALDALTKKNAELAAAAEAAQKKLDETTRTLSVQLAALKTQKEQSESVQKTTIDTLTGKNLELSIAAATAQKKLDETTRRLSAQIAALKTQDIQNETEQKKLIGALQKKNAELTTSAETAQKKYDASVRVLNDKNKKLQSTVDGLAIKKNDINLADKNNKNAYALGVYYLAQVLSDANKMIGNDIKLPASVLVSGFNDAYNKTLQVKQGEIESIVNTLNAKMSSKYVDIEKRIMAKVKNKKYEILPNGIYLVMDKKGKKPYKSNESLSMNILEKKLDGTPILNTMNAKMVYDEKTDLLMRKVLSSGLKGGTVTLYGQAGLLYSTTPADISPDTLISITFQLSP